MKNLKITLLFTILTVFGFSQTGTKLSLSQIQYAPGAGYVPYTDATGKQTYSLLTTVSPTTGLLPTTTSLTINGTTKSFTSTPSFTVGDLFSTSSYTNPSWISSLAWSKITGTPTTISGYGITDPLIKGGLTSGKVPRAVSSSSLTDGIIDDNGTMITVNGNLQVNNGDIGFSPTYGFNSEIRFKTDAGVDWDTYYPNPLATPNYSQQASHIRLYHDASNTFGFGLSTGTTIDGTPLLSSLNIASNQSGYGVISLYTNGTRRLLIKDNGDVKIYQNLNLDNTTANSILYSSGSKNVASVVLGSGLSLSSGTLTATGSGSTTTVTAGSNITVTGSAPDYTVGVSIALTNSVAANTSSIATLAANEYASVQCGFTTINLADGTTYYFATLNSAPLTASSPSRRFRFPFTGKIVAVYFIGGSGTVTSSQDCTLAISNVTSATTTTLGAVRFDNVAFQYDFTGLAISGSTSDQMEVQLTTPALTTNGTNSLASMQIIFKKD